MLETISWADRKFDFDFPVSLAPELLERLRGTPARLADRLTSVPSELVVVRHGDNWSIQEHAGHLADVEELFLGRLDDYDQGVAELRPAEMSGRKTFAADHNSKPLEQVLQEFRDERGKLVARLDELDEAGFARSAFHPRLEKPMRVCDMMLFEATHDDYHLVEIAKLIESRPR